MFLTLTQSQKDKAENKKTTFVHGAATEGTSAVAQTAWRVEECFRKRRFQMELFICKGTFPL